MKNIKSSSKGLDENMNAAKENFLLRGYFRRQAEAKAEADEKIRKDAEKKMKNDEKLKKEAEKKKASEKKKADEKNR